MFSYFRMNIHREFHVMLKFRVREKKQMVCGCYKELRSLIRKISENNVPKL